MLFFAIVFRSSPEDGFARTLAFFLALLDAPFGPDLPARMWLAGVEGRELSGVGTGVFSVEEAACSGVLVMSIINQFSPRYLERVTR